jgi:hypothetical protein
LNSIPSFPVGQQNATPRPCTRRPQRITITIPWQLYQRLIDISDAQGRSLSNLACYWLERQSGEN